MLRQCYKAPVEEHEWPNKGDCGPASIAKACEHLYNVKVTVKQVRSATADLLRLQRDLDQREKHVLNLLTGFYDLGEVVYQESGDGTLLGYLREAAYTAVVPHDDHSFFQLSHEEKEEFYAKLMLDETEAEALQMEAETEAEARQIEAYYMNAFVLITAFEVILCPPALFPRSPGRPLQVAIFLDPQSRLHESLNDNRFPLVGLEQYNDQIRDFPNQHPHRGPRAYIVHSAEHMVPLLIDQPDCDPPINQPPPQVSLVSS